MFGVDLLMWGACRLAVGLWRCWEVMVQLSQVRLIAGNRSAVAMVLQDPLFLKLWRDYQKRQTRDVLMQLC